MITRKRWVPWKRALVWAAVQDSGCCEEWRRIIRDSDSIADVLSRAAVRRGTINALMSVLRWLSFTGETPVGGFTTLARIQNLANMDPKAICERAARHGWDGTLPGPHAVGMRELP